MPFREGISALFLFCFFFLPFCQLCFWFPCRYLLFCLLQVTWCLSWHWGSTLPWCWTVDMQRAWCCLYPFIFSTGAVVKHEIFIDWKLSLDESSYKVADARGYRKERHLVPADRKLIMKKRRISWSSCRSMREFQSWAAGVPFPWEERPSTSKFIVIHSRLQMIYLWKFLFDHEQKCLF